MKNSICAIGKSYSFLITSISSSLFTRKQILLIDLWFLSINKAFLIGERVSSMVGYIIFKFVRLAPLLIIELEK